jgi:hypothetical protein
MNHYSRPPQRESWFAPLSIDLIIKVLKVTFLHPFICWIIPMCFRAQEYPWDHPKSVASIAWASFVTICWMAGVINARLAFGLPRYVEPSEEVIVITGGASGLGLLLAEVYGMRGANVAVLDINEMDTGEARGVSFYKCDITDKDALAKVAKEIEEDVSDLTNLPDERWKTGNRMLIGLCFFSSVPPPSSSTTPPSSTAKLSSIAPLKNSTAPSPQT